MTDVVAALIWDHDRFLICQRPEHKARGLLWEFVGGKVEPGETPQQALIRECKEELDITVRPGPVYMELVHVYPDLTVRLILFLADIAAGTPTMLEHNDIRWIRTTQIDEFDFCPADTDILSKLKTIDTALQCRMMCFADVGYKLFQCSLMPGVDPNKVIGVRMPVLRKIAKEFSCTDAAASFLDQLPHKYYEENNLHGILISKMQDFDTAITALDQFLPYVDNWATCDLIAPKAFRNHSADLMVHVQRWLSCDHTYTVRFALGTLMRFFLSEDNCHSALKLAASVKHEDYYVNMMVSWLFATALALQCDAAIPFLTEHKLSAWIHNKTIQKAIESYRIPHDRKAFLKSLKYHPEKR